PHAKPAFTPRSAMSVHAIRPDRAVEISLHPHSYGVLGIDDNRLRPRIFPPAGRFVRELSDFVDTNPGFVVWTHLMEPLGRGAWGSGSLQPFVTLRTSQE